MAVVEKQKKEFIVNLTTLTTTGKKVNNEWTVMAVDEADALNQVAGIYRRHQMKVETRTDEPTMVIDGRITISLKPV